MLMLVLRQLILLGKFNLDNRKLVTDPKDRLGVNGV